MEDKVRDGLDNLFPDRPDTPIPPTLAASQLAGTYYDPGYKGFTLREEENPDNSSETILVADRPEMTWRYQLKLRHVSADHWVVYSQPITGTALKSVYAGEFMIGVDGKVASLDIRMEEDMGLYGKDSKEGITSFKRVS